MANWEEFQNYIETYLTSDLHDLDIKRKAVARKYWIFHIWVGPWHRNINSD